MVTSAKEWKASRTVELDLPSGNVALVRNPGMQHFLKTGVIPDPMIAMVQKLIAGEEKEFNPSDFISDENSLMEVFSLFDRVLVEVVVEPKVLMPPENEDDRDEECLYADEVDFEDKSFIFQFAVGGTKDLEEYLQQQKEAVDTLQSGQGLEMPTQPDT